MQDDSQNYWHPEEGQQGQLDDVVEVPEVVQWQASEYIHHEKNPLWYGILVASGILLIIGAILWLDSWILVILLIVMIGSVWVFAMRPPRTMHYQLTPVSLHINNTTYAMSDFRSFGVVQEGGVYSIALMPTKRFLPRVNLYFPIEQGDDIITILEAVLPEEVVEFDWVDRVTRRLRF